MVKAWVVDVEAAMARSVVVFIFLLYLYVIFQDEGLCC